MYAVNVVLLLVIHFMNVENFASFVLFCYMLGFSSAVLKYSLKLAFGL